MKKVAIDKTLREGQPTQENYAQEKMIHLVVAIVVGN